MTILTEKRHLGRTSCVLHGCGRTATLHIYQNVADTAACTGESFCCWEHLRNYATRVAGAPAFRRGDIVEIGEGDGRDASLCGERAVILDPEPDRDGDVIVLRPEQTSSSFVNISRLTVVDHVEIP